MKNQIFPNVFSVLDFIICVFGLIIIFFNPPIILFCAAFSLLNSYVQVIFSKQNNFNTEILTIVVAVVISFFIKTSWFIAVAFALCAADVLFSVIDYVFMIFTIRRYIK